VHLFLLRPGDLGRDRFDVAAELQLEQVAVALGRPHVEIGHVAGAELESNVVASVDHGDCLDDLEGGLVAGAKAAASWDTGLTVRPSPGTRGPPV
jgi:hypothetical protein